jgi:hypothetical protein
MGRFWWHVVFDRSFPASAGFATILNAVTAITLLGVGLQMCIVVVRIYLSLRAKVRAQEALHRAVMLDKKSVRWSIMRPSKRNWMPRNPSACAA